MLEELCIDLYDSTDSVEGVRCNLGVSLPEAVVVDALGEEFRGGDVLGDDALGEDALGDDALGDVA